MEEHIYVSQFENADPSAEYISKSQSSNILKLYREATLLTLRLHVLTVRMRWPERLI